MLTPTASSASARSGRGSRTGADARSGTGSEAGAGTGSPAAQSEHDRFGISLEQLVQTACLARHVETLDFWVDPAVAFDVVVDSSLHSFWLDGGAAATSGWSHLGDLGPLGAVARSDAEGGTVTLARGGTDGRREPEHPIRASVFDLLSATVGNGREPDIAAEACGFELGWVGWLDYESGAVELSIQRAVEGTGNSDHGHRNRNGNGNGTATGTGTGAGTDGSTLLFADRAISFDHGRRQVRLSTLVAPGSRQHLDWCDRVTLQLRSLVGRQPSEPAPAPELGEVRMRHSAPEYRRLIASCLDEIAAGDAYQLCLTNRFEVATGEDASSIYQRLRLVNPTAHGGLIIAGPVALLSTSPEVFLSVDAGSRRVRTRPIKGTRPRGRTFDEDAQLREELRTDAKERAENVMIVDLMRNDLSKVSETGTVEVTGLFDVEEYANVFQLVSTVTALLRPEATVSDLLRSTFPAGSMTGAPKLSAMSILAALEAGPRGAYAGAFGYISVGGSVELAMTIRTIVLSNGLATMGSGGGITSSSIVDRELDETFVKIAPLLAALGAHLPHLPPAATPR